MDSQRSAMIAFLQILRGPAALLVVWSHFLSMFPAEHGFTPALLRLGRKLAGRKRWRVPAASPGLTNYRLLQAAVLMGVQV